MRLWSQKTNNEAHCIYECPTRFYPVELQDFFEALSLLFHTPRIWFTPVAHLPDRLWLLKIKRKLWHVPKNILYFIILRHSRTVRLIEFAKLCNPLNWGIEARMQSITSATFRQFRSDDSVIRCDDDVSFASEQEYIIFHRESDRHSAYGMALISMTWIRKMLNSISKHFLLTRKYSSRRHSQNSNKN